MAGHVPTIINTPTLAGSDIRGKMDVVWLKRDVRLHDHGPFAEVFKNNRPFFVVLYLYEPSQLSEPTVHGSHVQFVNMRD